MADNDQSVDGCPLGGDGSGSRKLGSTEYEIC